MKQTGRGERFSDFIDYLVSHAGGGTAQQIAQAIGVNRRSVYRYRDKAASHGHVVDDEQGYFRLRSPYRPMPEHDVTLTDQEIHALLASTAQRDHSPALRAALNKLRGAQNAHGQRTFGQSPPIYFTGQDDLPDGLLDQVMHTITARKTARVTYRNSRGQDNTHLFDAYGVIQRRDHLYVVGVIHAVREAGQTGATTLRLDGVQAWNLTRASFAVPAFDLRVHAQRSFGAFAGEGDSVRVTLLVSAEKAHAIARTTRHPSQTCTWQPDGTLRYGLQVPLSVDLVSWVVGYAGHLRVLEPPELREQVLAHARAVLDGME